MFHHAAQTSKLSDLLLLVAVAKVWLDEGRSREEFRDRSIPFHLASQQQRESLAEDHRESRGVYLSEQVDMPANLSGILPTFDLATMQAIFRYIWVTQGGDLSPFILYFHITVSPYSNDVLLFLSWLCEAIYHTSNWQHTVCSITTITTRQQLEATVYSLKFSPKTTHYLAKDIFKLCILF